MKLYLVLANDLESQALVIHNLEPGSLKALVDLCKLRGLTEVRFRPEFYDLRDLGDFPNMPTDGYLGCDFEEQAGEERSTLDDDFRIQHLELAVDRYGNIQAHALPKYYETPLQTEVVSLKELTNHG